MGGDEFVVLASTRPNAGARRPGRTHHRDGRGSRSRSTGAELFVTTSIGIASFPADGTDAETLVKHADVAMYRPRTRPQHLSVLHAGAQRDAAHAPLAREVAAQSARATASSSSTTSPHTTRHRRARRRRGAGALEPSALGTRAAGPVHPERGAERADRAARRLRSRIRLRRHQRAGAKRSHPTCGWPSISARGSSTSSGWPQRFARCADARSSARARSNSRSPKRSR